MSANGVRRAKAALFRRRLRASRLRRRAVWLSGGRLVHEVAMLDALIQLRWISLFAHLFV
jgi:hypothetical protein